MAEQPGSRTGAEGVTTPERFAKASRTSMPWIEASGFPPSRERTGGGGGAQAELRRPRGQCGADSSAWDSAIPTRCDYSVPMGHYRNWGNLALNRARTILRSFRAGGNPMAERE